MSVLIVAEVGSVHDGSLGQAGRLVEEAAAAGADAVKFQTHIAEAETLRDAPSPAYFQAEPRYEYFERTAFDLAGWRRISAACAEADVRFASSPFSVEAVELLEAAGVELYKVASGEVTNLPLLRAIRATGKPVLLSSGMSDLAELDAAVAALDGAPVTVLQCTSMYPCPPEGIGLNLLAELRARYARPVGLSDHSQGLAASIAAVALGATAIEKHFTLSRRMYGSDAPLATEPDDFAQMVADIRAVERMLASPVDKDDLRPVFEMKRIFEKSLVTRVDIPAGTVLSEEHLTAKKPGSGIRVDRIDTVLGRRARRSVPAGALLRAEDLEPASEGSRS